MLVLTACVYMQHGNRFDPGAVQQLKPGTSTEQDATQKLGQPAAVSTYANGDRLLQWMYAYGTAIGIGGGAHVAILFGPDTRMIRVVQESATGAEQGSFRTQSLAANPGTLTPAKASPKGDVQVQQTGALQVVSAPTALDVGRDPEQRSTSWQVVPADPPADGLNCTSTYPRLECH
jgi:hypothetical protein